MDLSQVIPYLSRLETLKLASFLAGFSSNYGNIKDLAKYPISSVINGLIGGAVTCLFAEIVAGFIPPNAKFILTAALFMSVAYYSVDSLYRRSRVDPFD
jgi:hypothetical protein